MMILQLIKEEDVAEVLEIYTSYILNTAITYEYEVPVLESFSERVSHYTEQYPWIVAKEQGKIAGYAYASTYREREAYQWCCELSVYLRPEFQGMDLGRTLYSALMALTHPSGILHAYGVITVPNEPVIVFTDSLAFPWRAFRRTADLSWENGMIQRLCRKCFRIIQNRRDRRNRFMSCLRKSLMRYWPKDRFINIKKQVP